MKKLEEYTVYGVPIDELYIESGFNCRESFTPASVHSLSQSILDGGLQNPVFVVKTSEGFKVIAGHRRFMAIKWFVKWAEIPCRILDGLDERTLQVINFTENLERKDLNIVEEADTLPKLWPNGYPPLSEMAKSLGKSISWVDIRVKVETLEENIKTLASTGVFSNGDIRRLARFGKDERQKLVASILHSKAAQRKDYASERFFKGARRKNISDVKRLISKLMRFEISGLPVRLLAWTLGAIDDQEIDEEIRAAKGKNYE